MSEVSTTFSKIKISENKTQIHYSKHIITDEGNVKNVKFPMKCDIKPHKDFFSAFQGLRKYAIPYLELSLFKNGVDKKILDKHIVTEVQIFEDVDNVKIKIFMQKHLDNREVVEIKSSLIDLYDGDFPELNKFEEAYQKLIKEAQKYLDGKNGEDQLDLKFDTAA